MKAQVLTDVNMRAQLLRKAAAKPIREVVQIDGHLKGGCGIADEPDKDGDELNSRSSLEFRNSDCVRLQIPSVVYHKWVDI